MSRSRKHLPILGTLDVPSEKSDKQRWHRVMRRRERQQLGAVPPEAADGYLTLTPRDVSDPLVFRKLGKSWVPEAVERPELLAK